MQTHHILPTGPQNLLLLSTLTALLAVSGQEDILLTWPNYPYLCHFPVYNSLVTDHCPQGSRGAQTLWWPFSSFQTPFPFPSCFNIMLWWFWAMWILKLPYWPPFRANAVSKDQNDNPLLYPTRSFWHFSSLSSCVLFYRMLPLVLLPSTT